MPRHIPSRAEGKVAGVIDIGSAKVCCLIAGADSSGAPALMGFGHQRAQGIKSGVIVDPEAAERAIRAAVAQAERMAGIELSDVVVSAICGRPRSQSFVARAATNAAVVTQADMERVIYGAESYAERNGRSLLQLTCSGWRLDGAAGIRDPKGLAARELAADIVAVTADEAPLRNLINVVERCHLTVGGVLVAPFASALAVTTAEERQGPLLVVDIGGGVTSLAAFSRGIMIWTDAIPVAGGHMTYDVQRALGTTVAEAERIKTLYGTLVRAASDAAETISYPVTGDEEVSTSQTTKARLSQIIEPRAAHLLSLIEERLESVALKAYASGHVVITGGGSQLLGIDKAWMHRFGGSVRCQRPKPIGRMPANMMSPLFATVIGLALGEFSSDSAMSPVRSPRQVTGGYLGRMKQWLSESF